MKYEVNLAPVSDEWLLQGAVDCSTRTIKTPAGLLLEAFYRNEATGPRLVGVRDVSRTRTLAQPGLTNDESLQAYKETL